MRKETASDKVSRLRQMAKDNGDTWDLSCKDQAAIQFALNVMNVAQAASSRLLPLPDDLDDDVRAFFTGQ